MPEQRKHRDRTHREEKSDSTSRDTGPEGSGFAQSLIGLSRTEGLNDLRLGDLDLVVKI